MAIGSSTIGTFPISDQSIITSIRQEVTVSGPYSERDNVSFRVRRLDSNWDNVAGQGKQDFITGLPAVAQVIKSSLLLLFGEWWEDTKDGLPLFQKIVGVMGAQNNRKIDVIISQRILKAPHVKNIVSMSSAFNKSTRHYSFSATVNTEYGKITVSNVPAVPARSIN